MIDKLDELSGGDSNRLYCARLAQLEFPDRVWIEGVQYTELQLKAALEAHEDLLDRLVDLCFLKGDAPGSTHEAEKAWNVSQVLLRIFSKELTFGNKTFIKGSTEEKKNLYKGLLKDPKLQQFVAARRYYMPSKWLVEQERIARVGQDWEDDIYTAVAKEGLTGVCFSGGGIRSATFNLGVIQGLAQMGMLPCIHYLSSVSGGGYVHEFLAGWILRNGSQKSVIRELIPQSEPGCLPRAPEPIQWLKRYASYLTPARGLFSADTWTMLAIWFRNTILNQIPILAAFGFALFAVHLLVPQPIDGPQVVISGSDAVWWATGLGCLVLALVSLWRLWKNMEIQEGNATANATKPPRELLSNSGVVTWLIAPWLSCAVWISYWVGVHPGTLTGWWAAPTVIVWVLMLTLVQIVTFSGGALGAFGSYHPKGNRIVAGILYFLAGVLATAVACAVGWWLVWVCGEIAAGCIGWIGKAAGTNVDPWRIELTLLPAMLLSVPYVAMELTLGLLGRDYRDMRREWLARLRAWSLLYASLWMGVVGLTLLGPYVGLWVGTFSARGQWSVAIGFVAAHLTTVLGGASGKADGKPTDTGFLGYKPMDLVAIAAAPFAMVSLLLLLSYGASTGVDALLAKNWGWTGGAFWHADVVCALAALTVASIMGRRVDINEFSMHTFYKNRLSRCYLGAVVPGRREPDPFTGFDGRGSVTENGMQHNLPPFVTELLPNKYALDAARMRTGKYDGPFPIFCSTLNLTTGGDLATQERKATSFAFTPLYSGYSVGWTDGDKNKHVSFNGYVNTNDYAYPKSKDQSYGGIHVDSAVAISGAAANPNMGYNTNRALAFLMTLFNVRLGWWIPNPRRMDMWNAKLARATPKFALLHLFLELFGAVGDDAKYINLSDGGHFENMGLYELVRRRCRYIIVCDAENDPEMAFGGMGMAITKCRADFGAEIDLDLRPLRIDPATGYSKAHCVVGTIQYPPPWAAEKDDADLRTDCVCLEGEDEDIYSGLIVYMKSSLVGDEPADLLTYQLKSPVFPQDSTANQWFTESQFEAYRRLGHHVALATMKPALPPSATAIQDCGEVPDFFARMNAVWYPRTPEMEQYLGDHLKQYEALLKELRERVELAGLEAALNSPAKGDEVVDWVTPPPLYAIQFANSLLDFMCTVYTDLQLAFPDNKTSPHAVWWICMFRRWCRVDVVRESWRRHADVYPAEFWMFARRELMLP